MVEVHGWITLRYSDYHSEDAEQAKFVYEFKAFIYKHYSWVFEYEIGSLVNRNGLECFTITAQHNHPDRPFYPVAIFTWVANNSTGSYGTLYFHDDEDNAYHNEFQVFVLKRGKFLKVKDNLLSPYIEEVEQEYDEDNPPLD
jgi:hypothetical protein